MKKIGIISLYGNTNYGNKLQNYAVYNTLSKLFPNYEVKIIRSKTKTNKIDDIKKHFKKIVKYIISPYSSASKNQVMREKNFKHFKKNFKESKIVEKTYNPRKRLEKEYDFFIVGSDQVWNPTFENPVDEIPKIYSLDFIEDNNKKIAFSASIGISKFPQSKIEKTKTTWQNFKNISVRENEAKKIIEDCTNRNDVQVLVDPTMLLTSEEWDKLAKKPKMLENEKYILNYFLGSLSIQRKREIERIAKENNCEIINILDKKDKFHSCGPSEFLYLEKNAFLICTDSFHSSVFAILYNKPFVVFDRDDEGVQSMGSRLDTLISNLKLKNRKYNGQNITKDNLEHDYTETYEIIEYERIKSYNFLKNAIEKKKQGK